MPFLILSFIFNFQTSLGLFNELDDFLFDDVLKPDPKQQNAQTTAYRDHDYVIQPVQSPSNSDSGLSMESGAPSPPLSNHEDQLCVNSDINSLSGSPRSDSQFSSVSYEHCNISPRSIEQLSHSPHGAQLSHSPQGAFNQYRADSLNLENIDFSDLTNIVSLDTIDTSALTGDDSGDILMDDDVAIQLGRFLGA